MTQPAHRAHDHHPDFDGLAALLCATAEVDDRAALTARVYLWYVNAVPVPPPDGIITPADVDLPAGLRAAHAAGATFEGGWRAGSVSTHARVVAERDGATRVLDRIDYVVPGRAGLVAVPGDALMAARLVDWLDEPSGFWYARCGDWPPPDADHLIRLYVNVGDREVGRALRLVTERFEAAHAHPYVLKVQTLPAARGRADAMVVYASPAVFAAVEPSLVEALGGARSLLRPATPRLTRSIVPGAALAEGAADGQSYGHEVGELAADAYESVAPAERSDAEAMLAALLATWRSAGYDVATPWRRPAGGADGDG